MLYLANVQIHILEPFPQKNIPRRGGFRLAFMYNNLRKHTLFYFPRLIQFNPYPSKVCQIFMNDLVKAGIDISKLPANFSDMDIVDLPYPIKIDEHWLKLTMEYSSKNKKDII